KISSSDVISSTRCSVSLPTTRPRACTYSVRSCRITDCKKATNSAAITTPRMEPSPPSTTMTSTITETANVNMSPVALVRFATDEGAAGAAARRAHGERHQLVVHVVDAHGPRRQLVLTDRHPGAPQSRLLKANGDPHCRGDEAEAEEVVRVWREAEVEAEKFGRVNAAQALGAVGERFPVARDDRHDLAEAQRDDGEVVAAQAEGGGAEERAEDRAHDRGDGEHRPEREVELHRVGLAGHHETAHLSRPFERNPEIGPLELEVSRRRDAVAIGADGKERSVAEVQQPREADDDVETQRQQDVGERVGGGVDVARIGRDERERQTDT